ncbi:HlyD family type I secretion periplasmic adaptor subunit [Desulfovibrio cuneatus]|uniref:HlyD family type I secretion periplasmic adaptor subunit n=1 Tax=Desulfovibrio cuneatus TaxID=159728 RepID=UPI0004874D0F|nr:HlyD family type I secretion periplasmic adaptor subunit [Desulfovibrio cuneatus]
MSVFWEKSSDPLNMTFMGDVDAAMHRRGHPLAFTLSIVVVMFFVLTYIWANFTMIEDVVRGNGKVIPAAGVRDIQSDKGGTISELRVHEGDMVEANQVVAVVANVGDVSALRELQQRVSELEFALLRLKAEAEGIPLEFPAERMAEFPQVAQNQLHIFTSNEQRFQGEDNQLRAQIEQRRQEVAAALQDKVRFQGSLEILRSEEATVRPLVGRSYSQIQYLDLQERIVSIEGELAGAEQTIARAQSAAVAAEDRLNTREAERQAAIALERNKSRMELDALKLRVHTWTEQVSRAELRSPVNGSVKAINVKEGSVARPADILMQIIASDDVLEIEAKFAPADRGFLYISQKGMAKFSSYDANIYGGLPAKVTRISDDTIPDKRGDPWYEVRLVTSRKSIKYQGKELPIMPGMTVSIDLLTDKRSVLDRILGPLRRAQDNAMTEH